MVKPEIAVIGAGASGTLTTMRLLDRARGRINITIIDPSELLGRGIAYSTGRVCHLLNVRAAELSAWTDRPEHFVRWLSGRRGYEVDPHDFMPRREFGGYLSDALLATARGQPDSVVRRVTGSVVRAEPAGRGLSLTLSSGASIVADAAVLALGVFPPGTGWAPRSLERSPRFAADPWAPRAFTDIPDTRDVLLVGTGLTMADMALALARPHRVIHAVSRTGLLPGVHSAAPLPKCPPPNLPNGDLTAVRRAALRHIRECQLGVGDWRPAVDSIRPRVAEAWRSLSTSDRRRFLAETGRIWHVHRHRMPPVVADRLALMRERGRLCLHTGEVVDAHHDRDGLLVGLSDGSRLPVGGVLNCTGAQADPRKAGNPLLRQLLADGFARPGPLDLGLDTTDDGRVVPADGTRPLPVWTLGSLRLGNLWETTAIAEIRQQATSLADQLAPPRHLTAP